MLARRDTGAKETAEWGALGARVPALLEQIQASGAACRRSTGQVQLLLHWSERPPAVECWRCCLAWRLPTAWRCPALPPPPTRV